MNQLFGQPADPDRTAGLDLSPASSSMRPLPVGGAEQAFFHLDVKRSLQLHWRLARTVAIGGFVVAALYFLAQALWFKTWPSYESQSVVYVQPTPPRVLETSNGPARWPYDTNTYESYIQQQMMNVSREDVLAAALKKLNGFSGPKESEQSAAQRLVRTLNVTREGSSYQFEITARAGSAQMAADIANAVTDAYMESALRDQKTGDVERLTILRDERDRIQKAMDADRSEQETLNRQLGVASVASVPDHFDEDITQTRAELVKARTEHDAAAAKFTALGAGHGPTSAAIDAEADALISNDAGLVSMKTALYSRRALLVSQMANLTPSHPQYKQDEVELARINDTLDEMVKNLRAKAAERIQSQLQADLQRTAGVESEINGQLRQLVSAAGGATSKMQRSSDLAADLTRLQARYAAVDEQLHNLLLEDNAPAAAYQITPALVPMGRTKSGVMRNVAILCVLGILLGVLAAVGVHKLDPKVYIASDVELILGFPPMAQLPDFDEVSEGVAQEYLLRLASSLEHARKQSNLRSCIFTGTNAGNGVTMLVGRLGEMLEAMGRPTVLVNARGSAVPEMRERLHATGAAAGLVPVERLSRPTVVLQQMAEETETQDESIVLTDTAPLAVSADTEYLARFVDCAIVVIESGKTTRRELRAVAATLQRLDVAAVGFVLNRVGLAKADPAFKRSVKEIEKYLGVPSKSGARRADTTKPLDAAGQSSFDAPQASETFAANPAARSLFEPEVAAAAAAVARVSSPAQAIVPEPVAANAEQAGPVGALTEHLSAPILSSPIATAPATAPFVEEAKHFSSSTSAGLGMPLSDARGSAPFAEVAKHFAAPVVAASSATVVGPETAPAESSQEQHEGAATPKDSVHWIEQASFEQDPIEQAPFDQAPAVMPALAREFAHQFEHPREHSLDRAVEPLAAATPLSPVAVAAAVAAHAPADAAEAASGAHEPDEIAMLGLHAEVDPAVPSAPMPAEPEPDSHRAGVPEIDVPWWLSEQNRHPEPQRPPVLWKPAKVWLSQDVVAKREPLPEGPTSGAGWARTSAPSQSWDAAEPEAVPAKPPVDADPAPPAEAEDAPPHLTSRLSGLRNLLFVMGVKDPHNPDEPARRYPNIGEPVEVRTERPPFDRMGEPDPDFAIAGKIGGASPRLVTAPPEFLPPRPIVINLDKDGENLSESARRQDRRAAFDGVEILPSKRGQYRKI